MYQIIDFNELETRGDPGEEFEQLMRALFQAMGLEVNYSGRGPDEERDLFVWETLVGGITGIEKRKWIVWCRNHAKTNASVKRGEIPSITELCLEHDAHGFLLASTTMLSSGAQKKLDALKVNPNSHVHIGYLVRYDIEKMILENQDVFRQFLPNSFQRYRDAQSRFFITESELQRTVSEIDGKPLAIDDLRNLLVETLRLGMTDIGQVREILEDNDTLQVLREIYHRLLGRDIDPSGHFTWGNVLKTYGLQQGKRIVEREITLSDEFFGRTDVRVNFEFGGGPDFELRFDRPGSGMGWRAYRIQNCVGTLSRIASDGDVFMRISSSSPHGIRVWYPDARNFGLRKARCELLCRYRGIVQVFFWFKDTSGGDRWLCYQTHDTATSDADRQDPNYGVIALKLDPGHKWETVEFDLANDYRAQFQSDVSSVLKICFHSEGELEISRITFSDESRSANAQG